MHGECGVPRAEWSWAPRTFPLSLQLSEAVDVTGVHDVVVREVFTLRPCALILHCQPPQLTMIILDRGCDSGVGEGVRTDSIALG